LVGGQAFKIAGFIKHFIAFIVGFFVRALLDKTVHYNMGGTPTNYLGQVGWRGFKNSVIFKGFIGFIVGFWPSIAGYCCAGKF